MTIEDARGERDRACPRHAADALNHLTGARVIWDDTQGTNGHEATALRLAEDRSQLAKASTAALVTLRANGNIVP